MKDAIARLDELFKKYMEDTITENELAEFSGYVEDPIFANDIKNLLGDAFNNGDEQFSIGEKGRTRIKNAILDKEIDFREQKYRTNWFRFSAVAAVLIAIFFAVIVYNELTSDNQPVEITSTKQDIAPGGSGATLTLANGKKIKLNDASQGKLAEESGILITKSANGQLVYEIKDENTDPNKTNTLSTDKGETYQVRLPDGSEIWLNAASSITYSTKLISNGKRRVNLIGEGYFSIAKDKLHPFVVTSKGQEVEVLGTQFNVNAYNDEPFISTTLFEGSVKVIATNAEKIIKPGEQANNNGTKITIKDINFENITDWKEGDFFLDRINFKVAMRKIARWYNVQVVYDSDVPDTLEAGGWISRTNSLSAVLKAIEKSGIAHFKVEGRTVYVSK